MEKLGRRAGGITLSALGAFVAVIELGSVSRAAERLDVSQPSVSIQLDGLERACGVLLLHRRPKILLTEAGRDLYVRARQIVSRLEEFKQSVGDLLAMRRGRLSIGLSTPQIAMPLIGSFLDTHGAVTVTTEIGNTTTLLAGIADCRIDVAIMTMIGPAPNLACLEVASPSLGICVRVGDPLARRAKVRPHDLVDVPFVMREPGSMTRQLAESAFAAAGVKANVKLEIHSREAMKEAVAAGLGVGVLFTMDVANDPRLAFVELVGVPKSGSVFVVSLKESLEIPTVAAFLDHVQKAPAVPPTTAGRRRRSEGNARRTPSSPAGPSPTRRSGEA